MQYLVTGYDGTDPGAAGRRQAAREAHLESARRMYREHALLYAAAILSGEGSMVGSVMIVEFSSEEALRETWLSAEPYVTGDVWREIQVQPCRTPDFLDLPG